MLNLEGSVSGWLRRSHPYRFDLARTLVRGGWRVIDLTEQTDVSALLSFHTTEAATNQPLDKL